MKILVIDYGLGYDQWWEAYTECRKEARTFSVWSPKRKEQEQEEKKQEQKSYGWETRGRGTLIGDHD